MGANKGNKHRKKTQCVEKMVYDPRAYKMYHEFTTEWPCLSFDIIQRKLCENEELNRKVLRGSQSVMLAAGTQADKRSENRISIIKCLNVCENQKTSLFGEEESSSDESEEEQEHGDPVLMSRSVYHEGAVNKIKEWTCGERHIVASWSDTGNVGIFDMSTHVKILESKSIYNMKKRKTSVRDGKENRDHMIYTKYPSFTINDHTEEGYAMDWCGDSQKGTLVTGDNAGSMVFTEVDDGGLFVKEVIRNSHEASVEDLKFSPHDKNVLASGSSDKTIKMWDPRDMSKYAGMFKASESDVNVISWNRRMSWMLSSGHDDGSFSVWDIRAIREGELFKSEWHEGSISSIEWHPDEESMLAVSGSDNKSTIWDLSLEKYPDEEEDDIPPQLIFIHQGQTDPKDLHWHPQIKNCIISTSLSSFNILRPINL